MHREGADPDSMTEADILCDFCGKSWAERGAMVEGHRGACICGPCLTIAYAEVVLHGLDDRPAEGEACTLCLEAGRAEPHWRSPVFPEALICRRCIKQAAGALHKDPDIAWRKPAAPTAS